MRNHKTTFHTVYREIGIYTHVPLAALIKCKSTCSNSKEDRLVFTVLVLITQRLKVAPA